MLSINMIMLLCILYTPDNIAVLFAEWDQIEKFTVPHGYFG